MKTTKKASKPKVKKSAEERKRERLQKDQIKLVSGVFKNAGFKSVSSASDRNFTFMNSTTDFDDIFICENIIVLCEYTISRADEVSTHLKKKKIIYDKIVENKVDFLNFFSEKFPTFKQALGTKYSIHQLRVIIVYCSLNGVKVDTKAEVQCVKYFDYHVVHYFNIVGKALRRSARFELFDYLGLEPHEAEAGVLTSKKTTSTFPGSILPESHSNFGDDFKVVSFYVDPKTLLQQCYVLRKYGWRAGGSVYQRMISPAKIASIRKYLREHRRVFINNIIVTLPDDTKLLSSDGDTIDPKLIQDTQAGIIQIPDRFNTIGIIDGQHRVFSYHEGGIFDDDISILREQQNLLVTGIVFPKGMQATDRLKFEAQLFLEINSNQTNARSDLKQEITLVINPFAPESIAKRIVNTLNEGTGPLSDEFERFFFEKGKLKTTSVVSFAIKPLTSPQGKQSLFALWTDTEKNRVTEDAGVLDRYVTFCTSEINKIFSAAKSAIPTERWTADKKVPSNFLTTTNVNGLLACLRRVADTGKRYEFDEYREIFVNFDQFKFQDYRSSQYDRMGEKIFKSFFSH